MSSYDVIIAGGGPAGLSAALMLGRCRRTVLVCDTAQYRNAASKHVHGLFSRDGTPPSELLAIARKQLEPYAVQILWTGVDRVQKKNGAFHVELANGQSHRARRILLATGVSDKLPEIECIHDFYGTSVHHCPYCDAWEHRDQKLVSYGPGSPAAGLALSLKTWSKHVELCTGGARLSSTDRARMRHYGIPVHTDPVVRLEGKGGKLQRIVFLGGKTLACDALFFNTGQVQHCSLGKDLGCSFTRKGAIQTDRFERTCVEGIFAAGDCARNAQFVAVAIAQGTIAAEKINIDLQEEDHKNLVQDKPRKRAK